MLDVCLPGTGGMIPLDYRWLTCCWAECQGRAVLIDCGEGTQIALRKAGCKLSRLETLLITHFHADHIAGLPGLLLTLGNTEKNTPLTIVGPRGLKQTYAALTIIAPVLPFPVRLVEWRGGPSSLEGSGLEISWIPLDHSAPCLGYRLRMLRKPVFNPEKAEALDIPKRMYGLLHAGREVTLPDGRVIRPSQVLDGERAPITLCYCTDTQPVAGMAELARGADLFICEGMYGDEEMKLKMEEKGHMLFSDSARIAREAGVKRLWLTHYSPALKHPEDYVAAAQRIFPQTVAAHDGIKTTLGGG